jgi:serine/threonine protein kinase
MEKLHHHHIASLSFYVRDDDNVAFSIVMLPVADYNLLLFLQRECSSKMDRTRLTKWFGCLVSALAFAHSQKVKHE